MSPKIKQALSLLVSTTVVLAQTTTYASSIDDTLHKEDTIIEGSISKYTKSTDETLDEAITSNDTQGVDAVIDEDADSEDNENLDEITDEITTSDDSENIDKDIVPYAAAANPYVVYTQITKSSTDRSGNGTAQYPYNRFEDAVANVADGGTIIIKTGRSGFINTQDEYGQIPYIIDKDVTIRSESSSEKAVLNVRAAGIILEGDVTFENIEFSFANKVHDGVFANGYTLEIIDCVRGSGTREIDLFAGSLYNTSGKLIEGMKYTGTNQGVLTEPKVGSNGEVIIKTTSKATKSQFGKVFAGSMNGHFNGNANIEIINNGTLDLVGIYACGGHEAEAGNMFDITEPLPPEERPDEYRVSGVVNISMENYTSDVSGKGADEVNVELSAEYPKAYFKLNDINSLTINSGRFIPDEITWNSGPGDITLSSEKAHLDLSEIKNEDSEYKFTVKHFIGGGVLTLHKEGELTIAGELSGETVFQTVGEGPNNSFSGPVIPLHTYIKSNSVNNGSFKFTPSTLQSGCTLYLDNDGNWVTSSIDTIIPDTITKLAFNEDEIIIDSNTTSFGSNAFEIESNLTDHIFDWYFNLAYELSVTGYDVDYSIDTETESVIWNVPAANVSFFITEDHNFMTATLAIEPITLDQPITPGKYEVKLSLSDYGVSTTYILNVVSDTSTSDTHNLDVTIKNNTSNDSDITFGDEITIGTNINKSSSQIESYILEEEYDFYVNDKLVYSGPKDSHTLNVSKDLFKAGENVVKVLYGGSDTVGRLIGSTVVNVNKTEHTINLPPEFNVTYDGKPHALTASVETLPDVEPIVYYYTNEAHTEGETTTPPVNVGKYYVKAVLPESEYYTAALAKGTITIQKATPQLSLSGIPKENKDLEVSVSMLYPEAGQIPNGKIQLDIMDTQNITNSETVELKNGSLTHTFSNIHSDEVTVTATYIPEVTENGNTYYDPYYNGTTGVSETFKMIDNYIPVKDIEFVAPEIQLYVQHNGLDYQNLTNTQLPVMITPNNASNQAISWTSSNPSIITISENGQVEVYGPGKAIITAAAKGGNVTHTCEVTVLEMTADITPVDRISLDKSSMNLDLTTQLKGVINATLHSATHTEPIYTDITWKSMDTSVVDVQTVDNSKMVTVEAKGEGTTTIVAVTKDGAKVATCTVTVAQEQIGSDGDGDSSMPDIDEPETDNPDGDEPDVDVPEVEGPETDNPENGTPELDKPEADAPGVDKPETDNPDNIGGSGSGSNGDSSGGTGNGSNGGSSGGSSSGSSTNSNGTPNNGDVETNITDNNITNDTNKQPSAPSTTITNFTDITNHWAKGDIEFIVEKGLFKGISDTNFGANTTTTRGMFVTALHRLAGTPQLGSPSFTDVAKDKYYTDAVSWAHTLGLVSGTNETQFAPDQEITREQLIVILYNYATALNLTEANNTANIYKFKDAHHISSWSKDAMQWALSTGILVGNPNNRLAPKESATRAQVATLLKRFIEVTEKTH